MVRRYGQSHPTHPETLAHGCTARGRPSVEAPGRLAWQTVSPNGATRILWRAAWWESESGQPPERVPVQTWSGYIGGRLLQRTLALHLAGVQGAELGRLAASQWGAWLPRRARRTSTPHALGYSTKGDVP